jgi:hypothetical protein
MNRVSSPENPLLILDRFNGTEGYPIELAQWNLYRDDTNGLMNLWIYLKMGKGIFQQEDTKSLGSEPNWELNYVDADLTAELLQAGFSCEIPECYDESKDGWVTNFYFCAHEGTDRNAIKIIEAKNERIRFQICGETIDVNYYDGSKPAAKLSVDVWFERHRDGKRSMS